MSDKHQAEHVNESQNTSQREAQEILLDIQEGGEQLMAAVQELIEWTDVGVFDVVDYLKRIANFLDAIIEAHPKTYAIAELTEKLELDEPTLRQLLVNVGTEIDLNKSNPEEKVEQKAIIALLADRAGSPVGDRLMALIRGERSYSAWS
jgi:hypothetical protein